MHHPEVSLGKQELEFTLLQSRQVIPRFTTPLGDGSAFQDGVLFVVLMFGIFMACSKFDLLAELEPRVVC